MKTLFLHIGTEKTGTKTIQAVLDKNRDILADRGYLYFSKGIYSFALSCMSDNKYGRGDDARNKNKVVESTLDSLKLASRTIDSVIVSAEFFHSRTNLISEIEKLKDCFSEVFDEIKVICYLREQSLLCSSLYSTSLRCNDYINRDNMLVLGDIPLFRLYVEECCLRSPYYNYFDLLNNWASIFGENNIVARLFSLNKFVNNDLIDDFFSIIDQSLLSLINKDIGRKNESLNDFGLFAVRALNNVFSGPERREYIRYLNRNAAGNANLLTKEMYDRIYDEFRLSNIQVNQKFFNKHGELFEYKPPRERYDRDVDLGNYIGLMSGLLSEIKSYQGFNGRTADTLRDSALALESIDVKMACSLMKMAQKIRPNGPLITKKVIEYESLLKAL